MIFKGINFKQFLSTHEEFHALVDGWGIVMMPLALVIPGVSLVLLGEIEDELHYFLTGGVLGVWTWVGIVTLLAKAVF